MTPDEGAGRGSADDAPGRSVAAGLYEALSTMGSDALSTLGRAPQRAADIATTVATPITNIATTVATPITALGAPPARPGDLRRRGIELSQRSELGEQHPALAGLLDEMTSDEARIVRFLAAAGPQPAIDVRTKTLFQVGSQSLACGVNLIARMAGCREPQRDQLYLSNLNRLGLVWFSAEPVADYRRYALLEVQPRALEAEAAAKRTISIYRSICLTVLGEEFCACCFDTDGYHGGGWDHDPRRDQILGKRPLRRQVGASVTVAVHGRSGVGVSTVTAALSAAGIRVCDADADVDVLVKPEDTAALNLPQSTLRRP